MTFKDLAVSVCRYGGTGSLRLNSVEDENSAALEHIPFVEGQLIDIFRDEGIVGNAHSRQHRLLPEACTSLYSCECIDHDHDDNPFDWSRD